MDKLPVLLLAACVAGCSTGPSAPGATADEGSAATMPAPGSDRDAHGCIPSAGYAWCAKTAQCERPWELARAQGLNDDAEAFDAFCGNPEPQEPATGE
ncbi:MAG TPA: hypothetical protein VFF71_05380 [Luteimonas sp.]|nr:hypothetical protein [Luteimonas sp.]